MRLNKVLFIYLIRKPVLESFSSKEKERFLISHNVDLCATNDRGMTAFHIAAFLGSLSVLQELLTSSLDDEIIVKALNQGDNRNQTPLFYACIEGHLDIALALLRAGANVYHLDTDDQTCLHAMLSSSIILKRHIRLFYRFIEFVDYRMNQDYLGRTLLDLAYLNQLNSIIYLLILLNYRTNSNIVFNTEQIENRTYQNDKQIHSLRHLCILSFKRSIIYHRNQRQLTQHDLLENAFQQTFQITTNTDLANIGENGSIEYSYGKSLDDISLLQQSNKYQKNVKPTKNPDKKLRKTSNIFSPTTATSDKWSSQNDLQHTHSTWSVFTNKLKGQRAPPGTTYPQQKSLEQQTNSLQSLTLNPMKNLALAILKSPSKLDDLLDFPSLNNNRLLNEDLNMSMNTYHLLAADSSNQT
jgi:ankyrin repeat protein